MYSCAGSIVRHYFSKNATQKISLKKNQHGSWDCKLLLGSDLYDTYNGCYNG